MTMHRLKKLVNDVLVRELPRPLKRAIDDALAKGAPPSEVMHRVKVAISKAGMPGMGQLTYKACQAYVERWQAERGIAPNCVPCWNCGSPAASEGKCNSCGEDQPPQGGPDDIDARKEASNG